MTNEGVEDMAGKGISGGNGEASNEIETEDEVNPHGTPNNSTSSLSGVNMFL